MTIDKKIPKAGDVRPNAFLRKLLRRSKKLWSIFLERAMKVRFPTILAHLSEQEKLDIKQTLKEGDVILKDNCSYPLSQLSARLIENTWIHSGVYVGEGKIVDCGTKPFVAEIDIDEFLDASGIEILRPEYATADDRASLLAYLKTSLYEPFNSSFRLGASSSFYCTQLISKALAQMPNPINISVSNVLGKPVILVSDIERSRYMKVLYLKRSGYKKHLCAQLPACAAVLTVMLWSSNSGPQATLIGAMLAVGFLIFATNYFYQSKQRHGRKRHAC